MLAFDATGQAGDRYVVVLHGWPLNRSIWSEVTDRMAAAGFRVLAPDLPGFGDSPPVAQADATVEAYADEVANFLGAFGSKRFAVAGHSFGGYVALALAERRPDLIAGLGLVASRTAADGDAARQGRYDTIEKVRTSGTKVLLPGLAEKLLGPEGSKEWRPRVATMIERARPDGVIAGLAAMATRPDRAAIFADFSGPRLVVHGTADALIPLAEAADPEGTPPPVRAILPGVGHMPMWEAPEPTGEAIITWAQTVRP